MSAAPPHDEMKALLDMLSIGKYYSAFHLQGLRTVNHLIENPRAWKTIIQSTRDRETLEGYLALRQTKPQEEVEASERRLKIFDVVRTSLKQLRDLQLRKAEMERQCLLHTTGKAKPGGKGFANPQNSGQLDDLLDEIDEARERLEAAQKELAENSTLPKQPRKLSKPSTLKKPRAKPSGGSGSGLGGAADPMMDQMSPRVAGEPAPEPEDQEQQFYPQHAHQPKQAAPGPQPTTSTSSSPSPPRKPYTRKPRHNCFADAESDLNVKPAAFSSGAHTGVACGSGANIPRRLRNVDPQDIGGGWNRPKPVSKNEYWSGVRTKVMVDRDRQRHYRSAEHPEELVLSGAKANRFSLGMTVDFDHLTQMKLGATAAGSSAFTSSARDEASAGGRTSSARPASAKLNSRYKLSSDEDDYYARAPPPTAGVKRAFAGVNTAGPSARRPSSTAGRPRKA